MLRTHSPESECGHSQCPANGETASLAGPEAERRSHEHLQALQARPAKKLTTVGVCQDSTRQSYILPSTWRWDKKFGGAVLPQRISGYGCHLPFGGDAFLDRSADTVLCGSRRVSSFRQYLLRTDDQCLPLCAGYCMDRWTYHSPLSTIRCLAA